MADIKVIVAEFHQETNSFNSKKWTLDDFKHDTVLSGESLLASARSEKRILSGIVSVLDEAGVDIVCGKGYRSTSGGTVYQDVIEEFVSSLKALCEENLDAKAVVLGLHGATQGTVTDDVCGYIISSVRSVVGRDVTIAVGCDFHANVTPLCIESADFICGFQTYPHVDQFDTGRRAARLALEKVSGQRKYTAYTYLPMIVPASGYNTNEGSMAKAISYANGLVQAGVLEDYTVFQMQPWLDVDPAGSAILATSKDASAASDAVDRLSKIVFEARDEFWPKLEAVDSIIDCAVSSKSGKPVIIVDFADSPGGGAIGDNACVLSHLKAKGFPVKCALALADKESVQKAYQYKVGETCNLNLGKGTESCDVQAQILSFHDGDFTQEGPQGPGQKRHLGKTVVIRVKNVDVVLCEHLCGCSDIQVYRGFGIEPSEYGLVSVKANTSFRAGYSKITTDFHLADTEGVNSAKLRDLSYERIRREGFYPFDHLDGYVIPKPHVFAK